MLNWQSNCLNWGSALEKSSFYNLQTAPPGAPYYYLIPLNAGAEPLNEGPWFTFSWKPNPQ